MVFNRLRVETSILHERIERAIDIPARLTTVESYSSLLSRFYGFYAPIEERLAAMPGLADWGLDLSARTKAHLIRADLSALGCPAGVALPVCPDIPEVSGPPRAFGCLYVLEGATLGGQYVRKEVFRRFGFGPDDGCSFFASYGDRVGDMWKEFRGALVAYTSANPEAVVTVIAAAAQTFERFERWIVGGKDFDRQ